MLQKSSQWHCSKARFGTTRFCEKHQDCILKEMEGPKKRGRKPGSLRPVNADGMNDPVRDMQQLAMGAKQMSAIVSQAQAVAALTQLDQLQRVATTAITAVPMKTSYLARTTTADRESDATTTNAALDHLSQNVTSNVPHSRRHRSTAGMSKRWRSRQCLFQWRRISGRINLLALDVQTLMDG